MRWLVCCLLVISGFVSAQELQEVDGYGVKECNEPEIMIMPDGNNASSPEILDSQQIVENYVISTRDYLNCLLSEEKAIGDALTYERKKELIARYNLAVERVSRVVERFNQQLRIYQRVNEK